MQHKTVKLVDEQKIAAASQVQYLVVDEYFGTGYLQQLGFAAVFGIPSRARRDAESGERGQVLMFFKLNVHDYRLLSTSLSSMKNRYLPSEYFQMSARMFQS